MTTHWKRHRSTESLVDEEISVELAVRTSLQGCFEAEDEEEASDKCLRSYVFPSLEASIELIILFFSIDICRSLDSRQQLNTSTNCNHASG